MQGRLSLFVVFATLSVALPAAAVEIIVDNADGSPTFVTSDSWTQRTTGSAYDGTLRRRLVSTTETSTATFQPNFPTTDNYEVALYWGTSGTGVNDAKFTVYYNGGNQQFTKNQSASSGGWVVLGTFSFPAGSSANGKVVLSNQSSQTGTKYVFADAVRFTTVVPNVDLTMAVSPGGAGTTNPTAGSVTSHPQGTVVNISATENAGYLFDHWTVSAGSDVANPTSASTTVTMDVAKTVTAVFVPVVQVNLTMAVSPGGAGTTTPDAGGPYTYNENQVVSINAVAGPGYVFSEWQVSAGSAVANPTSPSTTVTMDVDKTVTAVFVSAPPVDLTMAVNPSGYGTTTPAAGGPYSYPVNQVVNITAIENPGYNFSQWQVSAGSQVANPTSPSTTVTMDVSKTVTAVFTAGTPEFRSMWITRFEWPVKDNWTSTKSNIDTFIGNLAASNFNAVIFQMRGQADTLYPSPYEPWSPIIAADTVNGPNPPFPEDPMAYVIKKAHSLGMEFHAYMNAHVAWQSSTSTPPTNPNHLYFQHCNAADPAHRDWVLHNRNASGIDTDVGTPIQYAESSYVWMAPGVPDFQAYWRKQIMYVIQQYDGSDPNGSRPALDGVHFDRIRTPSNSTTTYSHDPISVVRYASLEGNPASLGWAAWMRDQITRMLCDLYAQAMEVRPGIKFSSSPLGLYSADRYPPDYPQTDCGFQYGYSCAYQDAQAWLAAGAQDFVVPMIYWADPPTRTTNPNFSEVLPDWVAHRAGRHIYPGSTTGSHACSDLIHEIDQARALGAQGNCVFSYTSFTCWSNYSGAGGPYEQKAPVPPMDWKTNPTKGIIIGNLTGTDGVTPVVDARITRTGSSYTALSSADGVYSFLLVPPGTYDLTCIKSGLGTLNVAGVNVVAGQVTRVNLTYGSTTPPIITDQPDPVSYCPGAPNPTFTVAATGPGTLTYQWKKVGTGDLADGADYSGVTTTTLTVINPDAADVGDYYCMVSNGLDTDSNTAHLGIRAATLIDQQPQAQNVCPGAASATFSVQASGEGTLTYQWAKVGVGNLSDGTDYTGTTTAILTVLNPDAADVGDYTCTVTGDCGPVTSDAAHLGLKAATAIEQQPQAQNVCPGAASATFSVQASGEGTLTYQWAKVGVGNLTDGPDYSGTTTAILTVLNPDAGDVGDYTCTVTGDCGPVTSDAAHLGLKAATTIEQQPQAQDVCLGAAGAAFPVQASGEGTLTYQWAKVGVGNLIDGLDYSGTTTATLTVLNPDGGDVGDYTCTVTGDCGPATSDPAHLGLKAVTVIDQQPQAQNVCPGAASAAFTIHATGAGTLTYQWAKLGVGNLTDGVDYSGTTTASLTVLTPDAADVGDYTCTVTGECGPVTSDAAHLGLRAATVIDQQPQAQSVCPGATSVTFSVQASGEGTLTYQWAKVGTGDLSDGTDYSGTTTAMLTVLNPDDADVGDYTCTVTGDCGQVTSNAAHLSLKAATVIDLHPVAKSICEGDSTTFTVHATGEGTLTYEWRKDGGAISGEHYSGVNTDTLSVLNATSVEAGSYTCIVTGECGPVESNAATLTVDPCLRAIAAWRSVKTHGTTARPIALLPGATGNGPDGPTVEPRFGGANVIEAEFDDAITLVDGGQISVTGPGGPYTLNVSTLPDGKTLRIDISPALQDQGCYTITVGAGTINRPISGDADCGIRVLYGDTTGNGTVNLGDMLFTTLWFGADVAAQAHHDVNLSDAIDADDVAAIKTVVTSPAPSAVCP